MRSVERQTLIALKARRTSFRVVTEFLHITDLDVHEGICKQCGAVLAEHFPPGVLNPDELPNRLVEI